MPNLEDVANDPNYDAAASSASKGTTFVFIATCVYLFIFTDSAPGWLGGSTFVFVGMFVVSIAISMPFFFLKSIAPRVSLLTSIAEIAATVFITRAAFLWLFAADANAIGPKQFTCERPLPPFTLGQSSDPSQSELNILCECVWSRLSASQRLTAAAIQQGKENSIPPEQLQSFVSAFGQAMHACGAMRL